MSSSGGGKHEKLEIRIINGKRKGEVIECAFNPPEYSMEKRVKYGQSKATGAETAGQQFVHPEPETLSVELFFDASETGEDVRETHVDAIDSLAAIDGELHMPPMCKFVWGSGLEFTALVKSVGKRFTRFRSTGEPVRARVNLTLEKVRTIETSSTRMESPDRTKAWTVTEGDTLWLIASEEYDDAAHWRTIAEANDIENPRELRTGEVLELPPL